MTTNGEYFLEIDLKTFSKTIEIPLLLRKLGGKIKLKENEFKDIFKLLKGVEVQELYSALPEEARNKLRPHILDSLGKKQYFFGFQEIIISEFPVDLLKDHIDYFLNNKTTYQPDSNIILLAKKLLDNSTEISIPKFFHALKREAAKKELLSLVSKDKIAFVLSEDSDRLRNFAKKKLGLKPEKNINQMNRVKNKIRRVLKDNFTGTFEKNKTCNFTLANPIQTKNKHTIKSIVFEWDSWALAEEDKDNHLAFQFYFGNIRLMAGMQWYQKWNHQITVGSLPNLPATIQKRHNTYYLLKTDYKSLIGWIDRELVSFIKNF